MKIKTLLLTTVAVGFSLSARAQIPLPGTISLLTSQSEFDASTGRRIGNTFLQSMPASPGGIAVSAGSLYIYPAGPGAFGIIFYLFQDQIAMVFRLLIRMMLLQVL